MAEQQNPESQQITRGYFTTEGILTLSQKLSSLSNKWETLGQALGLSDALLQGLYPKEPDRATVDYLRQTLSYWLKNPKSASTPNTVHLLIVAVDGVDHELAVNLGKEFTNHGQEVTTGQLRLLCEKLHRIASKWRALGRRLEVPNHELNSINPPPNDEESMFEVLNEWVKRNADKATLACLCNALERSDVGEKLVSYRIQEDPDVTRLLSTD